MKNLLKQVLYKVRSLSLVFDIIFLPATLLGGIWFRVAKYLELKRLPLTKKILLKLGVFPLVDHYYEPQFNFKDITFGKKRPLHGIDLNVDGQLNFIKNLNYGEELKQIPLKKAEGNRYYFHNLSFQSGDAELYYSIIRKFKPKNIVEIGAGFSTLMALEALKVNGGDAVLTCVEPYEMQWLEKVQVNLIREKVENVDPSLFESLGANDIFFIDSSHVVRPQGDVLFEIFDILPRLKKGVLIHFHDIFTPEEYPKDWLLEEFRLWNEQYILEAFLSYNPHFTILAAMNFLKNNYLNELASSFPVLVTEPDREPGSLWLVKN